jgi:hypothetical protein
LPSQKVQLRGILQVHRLGRPAAPFPGLMAWNRARRRIGAWAAAKTFPPCAQPKTEGLVDPPYTAGGNPDIHRIDDNPGAVSGAVKRRCC